MKAVRIFCFILITVQSYGAWAQATDYAAAAKQQRIDLLNGQLETMLENWRYLTFAASCKVMPPGGSAYIILMHVRQHLVNAYSYEGNVPLRIFDGIRAAEEEGKAYAKNNGCTYWKEHPDEAVKVHNLGVRALR